MQQSKTTLGKKSFTNFLLPTIFSTLLTCFLQYNEKKVFWGLLLIAFLIQASKAEDSFKPFFNVLYYVKN